MRKLFLAYASSLLMSPISVWALGMGDIRVNSNLNQPLNAEIELHSTTKKDLDQLRITLAPNKLYLRADIERSHYLSKLKFDLIQRNGKHFISITTKKAFKVPFANFLVEATWGSGRLFREYTILLDPPEFIAKHARPAVANVVSNSVPIDNTQAGTKMTKNKVSSTISAGLSSGKIKQNQTLWHVAKNMAPENVSVEQMMMALLRDNPDAFIDNNINNLKTGYILRIKDSTTLTKMSHSLASKQVNEQYQTWKAARKQKNIENIVNRDDKQAEKVQHDGELSLVALGKTDKSAIKNGVDSQTKAIKEKLAIVNEDLSSKNTENQELKNRIKELETLIQTKISLLELKDRSLAILQQQQKLKKINNSKLESVVLDSADDMQTSGLTNTNLAITKRDEPTVQINNIKTILPITTHSDN